MSDPYEVLGVAKNAAAKDIKSAFRKLAKKYHPDQNPDDPKAKERFSAANQAYEILGDDKRRAAFDRGEIDGEGKPRYQGFEGAGSDPFAGFRRQQSGPGGSRFEFRGGGGDPFAGGDIFSEIFGHAFQRGASGAGAGGPGAGGAGGRGAGGPGAGFGRSPKGDDLNVVVDVSIEDVANAEKVTAQFPDGRKMAVKLPLYVEDGQTIRLKGQGEQGRGGEAGDALVKIRFRRHPRYTLDGRDLHADVPVPLKDAVLGARVAVETPTGRLALSIPAWSSSDKVLRLKGRGLPLKTGGHGDFYAHVRVMLPEGGDAALEALMRQGDN